MLYPQLYRDEFLSTAYGHADLVVSGFPSVMVGQSDVQLGYISYNGVFSGWTDLQIHR